MRRDVPVAARLRARLRFDEDGRPSRTRNAGDGRSRHRHGRRRERRHGAGLGWLIRHGRERCDRLRHDGDEERVRSGVVRDTTAERASERRERDSRIVEWDTRGDGIRPIVSRRHALLASEPHDEFARATRDANFGPPCDAIDALGEIAHEWVDGYHRHTAHDRRGSRRVDSATVKHDGNDRVGNDIRDHAWVSRVMRTFAVFKAAGYRFGADGCAFFAQALAFNAVFAVFPIVILTVAALASIFGGKAGEADTRALIASLAPGIQDVLYENISQIVAFRGLSGAIAVVALLWSGKNLFQGLAYALNRALGVPDGRPLVADILVALVMLPIIGTLFIVATIVPLGITFVVTYGGFRHAEILTQVVGYATGVILIFVITVVLYTYLPNRKVKPGFAIPGAIFVTVAWEIAQVAFALYTSHVDFRHVYGALAALALLLVWFYYMASIFLFGAQLSAQWAEQHS